MESGRDVLCYTVWKNPQTIHKSGILEHDSKQVYSESSLFGSFFLERMFGIIDEEMKHQKS